MPDVLSIIQHADAILTCLERCLKLFFRDHALNDAAFGHLHMDNFLHLRFISYPMENAVYRIRQDTLFI